MKNIKQINGVPCVLRKVHKVDADKSDILLDTIDGRLYYTPDFNQEKTVNVKPQHLYITTDENIKEGNWYLGYLSRGWQLFQKTSATFKHKIVRKIVATTNPKLIANGVASVPQQFIQDYCNKPVDEVWIEVENITVPHGRVLGSGEVIIRSSVEVIGQRIKKNHKNEIIIHNVEDLLLMECLNAIEYLTDELNTNQFDTLIKKIEKNL